MNWQVAGLWLGDGFQGLEKTWDGKGCWNCGLPVAGGCGAMWRYHCRHSADDNGWQTTAGTTKRTPTATLPGAGQHMQQAAATSTVGAGDRLNTEVSCADRARLQGGLGAGST